MAQIDVSEILSDPEFVDPIVIIHRVSHVDDFGENKLKESGASSFGCVQPASGKTLQRLPEALRVANVMSFWVKGKIINDARSKYPDVIVHKGARFTVQMVFDYTNWGEGWSEGTCVSERPAA